MVNHIALLVGAVYLIAPLVLMAPLDAQGFVSEARGIFGFWCVTIWVLGSYWVTSPVEERFKHRESAMVIFFLTVPGAIFTWVPLVHTLDQGAGLVTGAIWGAFMWLCATAQVLSFIRKRYF